MQPRRKFELDDIQKAKNHSLIDRYITDATAELQAPIPPGESIRQVYTLIERFTEEHAIDLSQLVATEQEQMRLGGIIFEALQKQNAHNDPDILRKLTAWRNSLLHARAGHGAHVAMHAARSTGMVDDLFKYGRVPPHKLATDLDIIQCLGSDLTHPSTIDSAGTYILPPVSLTESKERIKTLLDDASVAIQENNINGKVKLLIPVNCGDQHWCLVKCEFVHQVLTSAYLRDSMQGTEASFKKSNAFKNFSGAVSEVKAQNERKLNRPVSAAIEPIIAFSGSQKNGSSCGAYTVQAAYQLSNIDNDISQAKNDAALDFAFARQIAFKHPALGPSVANNLVRNSNGSIGLQNNAQKISMDSSPKAESDDAEIVELLDKITNKNAKVSVEEKLWVVLFDEVFAGLLQDLENAGKKIDSKAFATARQKATKCIGFFPSSDKQIEESEESLLDNNTTPKLN